MAGKASKALADVVGVRDAGPGDDIAGVRSHWVSTVDSAEQVAAVLRVATEHGLRVVPTGSGSKRDWGGAPEAVDLLLDLSEVNKVLEHAEGDLVVRAQAGAAMAEVQRVVRASGQQLAIDQPLPTATVGGVIATGTSGPGRQIGRAHV